MIDFDGWRRVSNCCCRMAAMPYPAYKSLTNMPGMRMQYRQATSCCRMAAMPYPAYKNTHEHARYAYAVPGKPHRVAGWRRCLIRPTNTLIDWPGTRVQYRQATSCCRMAAMPYPAYKTLIDRPGMRV